MAQYFLHQRGGAREFPDEEGQELESLVIAQRCAIKGIRGILADEIHHGRLDLRERIDICDSGGTVLMAVPFGDAVNQAQ